MSIGVMLSNLIIGPWKLWMETFFSLFNRMLPVIPSLAAMCLMICMLTFPLRRSASVGRAIKRGKEPLPESTPQKTGAVFHENRRKENIVFSIRKNGSGFLNFVWTKLPILAMIPVFFAAYQFLGQLGCLQGVSVGPVGDISQPDHLFRLGKQTINLLPILMMTLYMISGMIRLRESSWGEKGVWIGSAVIFLLVLYNASAAQNLFWILHSLLDLGGILIQTALQNRNQGNKQTQTICRRKPQPGLFFLCGTFLAILTGLLIPSSVLAASPQDFFRYVSEPNPIWYAVNAFLLAAGSFVLWPGVYYRKGSFRIKKGLEWAAWVLIGIFLVNYLYFRNNLGNISSLLKYDYTPEFSLAQKLINLAVIGLITAVFSVIYIRKETFIRGIAWALILAMGGMAGRNLWVIQKAVSESMRTQERNYRGNIEIPLSSEGKNVVVLMLDRAISSYLPCILHERADLKDVFSGFTYYPNTLSFGAHTDFGAPALFGGYEYVPEAMNARDTELLKDKHNEALLLMPTLFSQQGYKISIYDVPSPGDYSVNGDYTVFDQLPDTNARKLWGALSTQNQWERPENLRLRNFFCYSMSMVVPSALYGIVYNMGYYNRAEGMASLFSMQGDIVTPAFTDLDYTKMDFLAEYDILCSLKNITNVMQEERNTLLVMANGTAHEEVLLPEPEYAPVRKAENMVYDEEHADRFQAGPIPLSVETEAQMEHYEVNMAALLAIGEWIEFLKDEGVYDNTRIILVADHGGFLGQIQDGLLETGMENTGYNPFGTKEDIMAYNPLLMVKDFNASGPVRTDVTFMTNADVPTIAMDGLIDHPVNPFTGHAVETRNKTNPSYVITSHLTGEGRGERTTFEPSHWFMVSPGGDTLFDPSRWTFLPEMR